jgi:hypothetical protein
MHKITRPEVMPMTDPSMNRKQFLKRIGTACACSCAGIMAASLNSLTAEESPKASRKKTEGAPAKRPRSQERIEFAEGWAVRFFGVFDANLDAAARRRIMMANGRECLLAWQKETNKKPRAQALSLAEFAKTVKEKGSRDYQIDGNVIYFQYNASAETGAASSENHCLCPLVETKPAGLSATYCLCSLGYVKEMHEQIFKKPVEVELLSSVLRGDTRCKFKLTIA